MGFIGVALLNVLLTPLPIICFMETCLSLGMQRRRAYDQTVRAFSSIQVHRAGGQKKSAVTPAIQNKAHFRL